MACYRPVLVRLRDGDVKHSMPCGRCIGCDLERSRQWAVRCMHEASLYPENSFLTLTYDDAHLPVGQSLDRAAFPAFMKRLRKLIDPRRVRYFHCGEYGDTYGRPHYHACLFGYDFPDKQLATMRGEHRVWHSDMLEDLWGNGLTEIGSVTFESAAYVARYIMKKVRGNDAKAARRYLSVDAETGEVWAREPEYATMSRRPGIGAGWFSKYASDVYPHDELIARGQKMRPPRYYDKLLSESDPDMYAKIQLERAFREVDYEELTPRRLKVREAVAVGRSNLKTRGLS